MKTVSRAVMTAAAGVLFVGLSACSGNGSGADQPSAPAPKAIQGFDQCSFFKPDELASWGVSTQAQQSTQVSFEPGCEWQGEKMLLSLHKNAEETVNSYQQHGNWDSYNKKSIGGRDGAVAIERGATGQGGCSVLVDAGGGVAIYGVDGLMRDSVDACGEAEKIANQTASRLPK